MVGVAPSGFGGTIPRLASGVWVPISAARAGDALRSMSSWVAMFGRLRPGVGPERAAASFVLGRFLYGVSPLDPVTFAGVPVVLALVAVVASFVPVRRATRVGPITILRAE